LGGTGIAKGFNLARGEDSSSVRWSSELLERLTVTALLRSLAVAHFGRGRGEWSEGEHPIFWQAIVQEAVAERKDELARLLKASAAADSARSDPDQALTALLRQLGLTILARLYPGSKVPSWSREPTIGGTTTS
jgi:hypothetical protein